MKGLGRLIKKRSQRLFSAGLLILFCLTLAAALASPALAFQTAGCEQFHIVQRGETLSQIARRYGLDWQRLAEMNRLENPNLIYAGQRLCLAGEEVLIPDTGGAGLARIEAIRASRNDTVTIYASLFPGRTRFNVFMAENLASNQSTRPANSYFIGQIVSDGDGNFEAIFPIPQALYNTRRISIWLEGATTSWSSFTWFSNETFGKPSFNPILPELEPGDPDTALIRVRAGDAADLGVGSAGLYLPSSQYNAWAWLARYDPGAVIGIEDIRFTQKLIQVQLLDDRETPINRVAGVNYVYFTLSRDELRAYSDGNLGVLYYNPSQGIWQSCRIQALLGGAGGTAERLACEMDAFGLYGLARYR